MENEKDLHVEKTHEMVNEVSEVLPLAEEATFTKGRTELTSESDLVEKEEKGDHALDERVDYTSYSKKDFANLLKDLAKEENFAKVDAVLKEVKPLYDEIREHERAEALARFKQDGGIEEDFEYKSDEHDNTFDANYKLIRDKRNQYYRNLEERKNENLRKKQELLEKFRELVDGEDSENSFIAFKAIQNEWKAIGAIPATQIKTLWANYSALIDRFYDKRSIYFELKELDRKKNLELKQELCARAEKLQLLERVNDAVRELNELHDEFKHVGPVPKEEKENVWQRFKAASDAVYEKRDAFVENLQKELNENLEHKLKLADELAPFGTFTSDRIKEWNAKTQEILELQKKWDAIGGVPRAKSKEINKKFWSSFKSFFHNKNLFFKKLDEERDKNLQLKKEIVKRAEELKESSDWDKTSNELKELQRKWKDIGPVPEKYREKIFQEFKQACDFFFEQRRGLLEKADKEQEDNLLQKEAIIQQLQKIADEKTGSLQQIQDLQNQFNNIGFVPKRAISSIKNLFNDAIAKSLSSLELSDDEKERATLEIQVNNLRNDPQAERKIYNKEQAIRKQIAKVENDIAVLKNNLEFFEKSKNAQKFRDEFNDKIKEATDHLKHLKDQLKMLKTVS